MLLFSLHFNIMCCYYRYSRRSPSSVTAVATYRARHGAWYRPRATLSHTRHRRAAPRHASATGSSRRAPDEDCSSILITSQLKDILLVCFLLQIIMKDLALTLVVTLRCTNVYSKLRCH